MISSFVAQLSARTIQHESEIISRLFKEFELERGGAHESKSGASIVLESWSSESLGVCVDLLVQRTVPNWPSRCVLAVVKLERKAKATEGFPR